MDREEWLRATGATLGALLGDTTGVLDFVDPKQIRLADLALAYKLGLIGARDVIAIQLMRLELGLPLNDDEERIALTLGDDVHSVEDFLSEFRLSDDSFARAKEYWLYAIVAQLRHKWTITALDFPEQQFVELQSSWGEPSFLKSFLLNDAGLNRWYFGHGARRKFLAKLDRALADEGTRLNAARRDARS